MNIRTTVLGLLATVLTTSCSYRGAIHSEYTQIGLDVRANSASSTPILGSLGYDHAIVAFVPRRGSGVNGASGESVSVISWNYTGAKFNPLAATNSALMMDAGFISGSAAVVAAAPSNSVVKVVGSTLETKATVTTDASTAGERIAAASTPTTFGQDANTLKIRAWLKADPGNRQKLRTWLDNQNLKDLGISNVLNGAGFFKLRQAIVDEFLIE